MALTSAKKAESKAAPAAAATHVPAAEPSSTEDSAASPLFLRNQKRVRDVASAGVDGASVPLPHLDRIQASFGRFDVSGVRTRTGGIAADASRQLGARGFTMGDHIGFRGPPDVRLAAHEAAHTVQQHAGVRLAGGVGSAGDPHERQADAVADAVVEGRSAEPLLADVRPGAPARTGVQMA